MTFDRVCHECRWYLLSSMVVLFFLFPIDMYGGLDPDFRPGFQNPRDSIKVIAFDGGEWIILAGSFDEVSGQIKHNIARIDFLGQLDPTYNPNVNGEITSVIPIDQRLLIIGDFDQVNGRSRPGIAILNQSGSLYEGFDPEIGDLKPTHALVQSNGKIIVSAGTNPFLVEGIVTPHRLLRFNIDGSVDESFMFEGEIGHVTAFHILPTDQMIISHRQVLSNSVASYLGHSNVDLYSSNGQLEYSTTVDKEVRSFFSEENGQIVAVGCFDFIDIEYFNCGRLGCDIRGEHKKKKLVKFNPNLTVDDGFNRNNDYGGCFSTIDKVKNQDSPKSSSQFYVAGSSFRKISSTGDSLFDYTSIFPYPDGQPRPTVNAIKVQNDGDVLVANSSSQFLIQGGDKLYRLEESSPSICFPVKTKVAEISVVCVL